MSYFVFDNKGNTEDFATNAGLKDLHDLRHPTMDDFLKTGVCDETNRQRIIDECSDHPELRYVAELFSDMEAPITLTDGIGPDTEGVPELEGHEE